MDLLLDTHALLWLLGDHPRAQPLRPVVAAPDATVTISAVSYCEIAIKQSIGKLAVDTSGIRRDVAGSELLELAFTGGHAEALAVLPRHHRDPFDRMLIAQARAEELTIATADGAFARYDVPLLQL